MEFLTSLFKPLTTLFPSKAGALQTIPSSYTASTPSLSIPSPTVPSPIPFDFAGLGDTILKVYKGVSEADTVKKLATVPPPQPPSVVYQPAVAQSGTTDELNFLERLFTVGQPGLQQKPDYTVLFFIVAVAVIALIAMSRK